MNDDYESFNATTRKHGSSLGITIDKDICKTLKLKEKDLVKVKIKKIKK